MDTPQSGRRLQEKKILLAILQAKSESLLLELAQKFKPLSYCIVDDEAYDKQLNAPGWRFIHDYPTQLGPRLVLNTRGAITFCDNGAMPIGSGSVCPF